MMTKLIDKDSKLVAIISMMIPGLHQMYWDHLTFNQLLTQIFQAVALQMHNIHQINNPIMQFRP